MHVFDNLIDIDQVPLALLDYVLYPFITIILCLLSVLVVLGNLLVVTAIWHENQLHSVTNYLIASLAAADCLVGAVVMPFSIISEIIVGSWTFGPTWCDLWHSFDVLASTASIMNLCAISLDRYLAITNPICYPTKMTPKRVALLIVSLWTCSSLISFPAIIWWRAVGEGPLQLISPSIETTRTPPATVISSQQYEQNNHSHDLNADIIQSLYVDHNLESQAKYRCVFTDDTYYLLFSSFVSFYGPLCVMLYAYIRIYQAAVQQTRFLKYGSKQVMIGGNKRNKRQRYISEHSNQGTSDKYGITEAYCDGVNSEGFEPQHLVLRAHRGGGGASNNQAASKANGDVRSDQKRQLTVSSYRNDEDKVRGTLASTSLDHNHLADGSNEVQKNSPCSDVERMGIERSSSSNRSNRINLAISRRDKLRVESQRFDSNPLDKAHVIDSNKSAEIDLHHRNEDKRGSKDDPVNNNRNDTRVTLVELAAAQGKDLASTKKNGCLDSSNSVYHHPSLDTNSNGEDSSTKYLDKLAVQSQRASNSSSKMISSDERYLTGSTSTSGGSSYGTGSISSILVRPDPVRQKQNGDSCVAVANNDKNDCDTFESQAQLGQSPIRRALSFDEVEQTWSQRDLVINDTDETDAVGCDSKQTARMSISNSNNNSKHRENRINLKRGNRASYSSPVRDEKSNDFLNVTSNTLQSTRNLDIRWWVKASRNRCRKRDDKLAHSNNPLKPPPSLVPLIMMNSDTSTDSSIVTVETRTIGRVNSDRQATVEFDIMGNSDGKQIITNGPASMTKQGAPGCARGFKKTTSLESALETKKKRNENQVTINLGFREESSSHDDKRQILYYDSDKLIQSIVDLTAIHYIDCTKQGTATPNSIVEPATTTTTAKTRPTKSILSKQASNQINQVKSITLDQVENGQENGSCSTLTNVPRQQRNVGKKLTKLAKERKAAKTLGIVVGVFILCWLPFFVVNILVALCGTNCIYKPQILFSIVTWLGWLNSAMNPVIYACWSRDFRRAFRRVLCTWVEFLCYDGTKLAKKLNLKKGSSYSNAQHEIYLNRTASTARSGASIEGMSNNNCIGGGSSSTTSGLRSNSNNVAHKSLLSDQ